MTRNKNKSELEIIIAEDNDGHAGLIKMNLEESGIKNPIHHFKNGQETLDFLFQKGKGPHRKENTPYLLLLDIRMPKVDGIEVLKEIKETEHLRNLPVIMLTTTDDPREIDKCHALGCNSYITKPVEYEEFSNVLQTLGMFVMIMEIPEIAGSFNIV
jgi:CheY-like chemotaxis protein